MFWMVSNCDTIITIWEECGLQCYLLSDNSIVIIITVRVRELTIRKLFNFYFALSVSQIVLHKEMFF